EAFEALASHALSPEESPEFIAGAAAGAEGGTMPAPPRTIPSSLALHEARWLRSSYSPAANNCAETARPAAGPSAGLLAVRDSKATDGPALLFSPDAWASFVTAVL